MDEEEVLWPPGDGWPGITLEGMRGLGKTDQVVELLRRLPYVRRGSGERRLHSTYIPSSTPGVSISRAG